MATSLGVDREPVQPTGPFTSLRDWLTHLAGNGRLALARPGMGLRFEIAAVAKRLEGERAIVFPEPDDHDIPVVANVVGARSWIAQAMGVGESEVLSHYEAAAGAPVAWEEVSAAPVQEVIADRIDIAGLLPVPTHNEDDGGAYISAGALISRDPDTGVQNVSINRCQIAGSNRLGVLILPRHTFSFAQRAEASGRDLEVAIVIGADPLTLLASQAIVPIGHDELEIAGALHGRAMPVVKCRTNEIRVPAEAEIVLEGRVLANVREPEGPFGEFPQYYGPRTDSHVIEIDAVTHRRSPIFHTIVGGGLEHLLLGAIAREATLLAHLRRSFPSVRDVHLAPGGVCRYQLFVQIDKRQEGEPKNIIMGAFAGHYDVKHVVVVDTDVDIHRGDEVQWAISTRFQADRDLVIVAGAQGSKLDPSARDGVGAKMGMDATVPVSERSSTYKRIAVPGEDAVDLEAVVETDSHAARNWLSAHSGLR